MGLIVEITGSCRQFPSAIFPLYGISPNSFFIYLSYEWLVMDELSIFFFSSVITTSVFDSDSIKITCSIISLLKCFSNTVRCEFPLDCRAFNSSFTLFSTTASCNRKSIKVISPKIMQKNMIPIFIESFFIVYLLIFQLLSQV